MDAYVWLEVSHLKTAEKAFLVVGPRPAVVGRATREDPSDKLAVGFDPTLSRSHFQVCIEPAGLHVQRCPDARRPLFFEGQATDDFTLQAGQCFSTGQSVFRFVGEPAGPRARTYTLDPTMLSVSQDQDAARGLRALLGLLPLLSQPKSPPQLLSQMLPLLGEVVPTASAFLILAVAPDGNVQTVASQVGSGRAAPSRTIIREAIRSGSPVEHLWDQEIAPGQAGPTQIEGVSWALAAPIPAGAQTFVLYAIGSELDAEMAGKPTPGALDRAVLAMLTQVFAALFARGESSQAQWEVLLARLSLVGVLDDPGELGARVLTTLAQGVHPERATLWVGGEVLQALGDPLEPAHGPASEQRLGLPLGPDGWLVLERTQPFTAPEQAAAQAVANLAALAVRSLALQRQLHQAQTCEPATGLLYRTPFLAEAARMLRPGQPAAVWMIHLDQLANLNARFGYAAGDHAVHEVARRCAQWLGPASLLGLWSAGTLVALTPSAAEPTRERAEQLRQAMAGELLPVQDTRKRAPSTQTRITVSIGLGCGKGPDLDALVQGAEQALSAAQSAGSDRLA